MIRSMTGPVPPSGSMTCSPIPQPMMTSPWSSTSSPTTSRIRTRRMVSLKHGSTRRGRPDRATCSAMSRSRTSAISAISCCCGPWVFARQGPIDPTVLAAPWTTPENDAQKYYDPLIAALAATGDLGPKRSGNRFNSGRAVEPRHRPLVVERPGDRYVERRDRPALRLRHRCLDLLGSRPTLMLVRSTDLNRNGERLFDQTPCRTVTFLKRSAEGQ